VIEFKTRNLFHEDIIHYKRDDYPRRTIVVTSLARELSYNHKVRLVVFQPKKIDYKINSFFWKNLDIKKIYIPSNKNTETQIVSQIYKCGEYLRENITAYDRIIIDSWYLVISLMQSGIQANKIYQLVQSIPEFIPDDVYRISLGLEI